MIACLHVRWPDWPASANCSRPDRDTFGQVFVFNTFVVNDNPAATAANILGHESLMHELI
ncbi:MAG TPA: hypothetical protein VK807_14460 [Gemmatimonadaceae bacterium]|nr:hypothetical protein [Gemmatimonadaceae bacterium]